MGASHHPCPTCHRRTTEKGKPCNICQRSRYQCKYCDKSYRTMNNLRKHITDEHEDQLTADLSSFKELEEFVKGFDTFRNKNALKSSKNSSKKQLEQLKLGDTDD